MSFLLQGQAKPEPEIHQETQTDDRDPQILRDAQRERARERHSGSRSAREQDTCTHGHTHGHPRLLPRNMGQRDAGQAHARAGRTTPQLASHSARGSRTGRQAQGQENGERSTSHDFPLLLPTPVPRSPLLQLLLLPSPSPAPGGPINIQGASGPPVTGH